MKKIKLAKDAPKEVTPKNYGTNLYCVGVAKGISKQELYVRADNLQISENQETLGFITVLEDGSEEFTLILTAGMWYYCYLVNKEYPASIEFWDEKETYYKYKIRKQEEKEQLEKELEEQRIMEELEKEEQKKLEETTKIE